MTFVAILQSGQIDNPWSWVIAGYLIGYGSMLGLTGWLWVRLNRVNAELDKTNAGRET